MTPMHRPLLKKECVICGRRFMTRNPRRSTCFACIPPADPLERKAGRMLRR
jgi:hypothetical protein